jgi:predicted nuclease of predicted toxin-antitoxin system
MKLLLDECTPKRLVRDFAQYEVHTVEQAGLKGLQNGALLRAASTRYDVLITVDKNIPFQQKITTHSIAIIILSSRSNRYPELKMLAPQVLEGLLKIKPGEVLIISG